MEEYIISREYDGCLRKLYHCICMNCNKDVLKPKHQITEENFCSKICYHTYRQKVGKRIEFNCTLCNKVFKRFQHHADQVKSGRLFCSRECQTIFFTKEKGDCLVCLIKLTGDQEKYCSTNCQWEALYQSNIEAWKAGTLDGINAGEQIRPWLKRYLVDKYGDKCSQCNWCQVNTTTGKVPIQVDHVDGNYRNNVEENLRLLCPNCHSLTSTYGSLNIGSGREKRRLKLQGIKK